MGQSVRLSCSRCGQPFSVDDPRHHAYAMHFECLRRYWAEMSADYRRRGTKRRGHAKEAPR